MVVHEARMIAIQNIHGPRKLSISQQQQHSLHEGSIVHPSADAPICKNCHELGFLFFDPNCPRCLQILQSDIITIPQIFAIIRQWMPQTQHNIELLIKEAFKHGAHVNDRDGLTDMTLLHYACKSGANGIGNASAATKTVGFLLDAGADIHLRCCWTDMEAIHYASYFDVAPVVELLLNAGHGIDINSQCQEFEGGSPLHIACGNLCYEVAKILLEHGANVLVQDDLGRTPLECIPEFPAAEHTTDLRDAISNLQKLMESVTPPCTIQELPTNKVVGGKAVLKSMGIQVGDRVIVGSAKVGTLRYCGKTKFAQGIWAGVELDEPLGKNDGTLKGVTYFKCIANHGIFAPINKIAKFGLLAKQLKSPLITTDCPLRGISFTRVDFSHITSKVETGLTSFRSRQFNQQDHDLSVGDRVLVSRHRKGTVRFAGETEFASGLWYGIELDKPQGKNDGSVNNVQYFSCLPDHGVFAPRHRLSKICRNSEEDYSDQESTELSVSKSSTDGDTGIMSPSSPRSVSSGRSSGRRSSSIIHHSSPLTSNKKVCWLTVGVNVFVNNEIGAVRYIGPVDFADGTWLGIELRSAKGKNDGFVQGKRYFICRANHGLLVRPNRVTVRGINGARLLEEQD